MRSTTVFYFDIPFEERAKYIAEHYGKYPKEDLLAATERILRRLDTRYSKDALRFITEGNLIESFKISLKYYDKTYEFGLSKREGNTIVKIEMGEINPEKMAEEILKKCVNV
jgi:tRNA 2-selenouridine synthase